jgi:putative ABC transport system permease protein
MFSWFVQLSWPALRHQALRQLLALLAIMLGVALAYGVHLLNSSALAEFGQAAAAVNGQPDLVLRSQTGALDERLYPQVASLPGLQTAAPLLEGQAQATGADGQRFKLRVLGIDALQSVAINPLLLPAAGPLQMLDPQRIFLNDTALLAAASQTGAALQLRTAPPDGSAAINSQLILGGRIAATGPPLGLLDIAGAQLLLGRLGQIDRIDLRLQPGLSAAAWLAQTKLPAGTQAAPPPDEAERLSSLTRAYRVNLGVLSLMALFTGSFLVFAVLSLSVAQRLPQLALLGVLGMTARERAALVLGEALLLGLLGSLAGLMLGWGLAQLGLRILGADLGLAVTAGQSSSLQLDASQLPAALVFFLLGVAISLAAAAMPAMAVQRMPVAQVLKGLGNEMHPELPLWLGPALLLLGLGLAMLPPLEIFHGLPLAAYAGMLSLLFGGIACVPQLLKLATAMLAWLPQTPARLLVRERAHDQAGESSRALAGVLVSLSLSVAMLVMVGSFRESLNQWLTQMLPADLYLRSSLKVNAKENAALPASYLDAVQGSGLAARLAGQRISQIQLGGKEVTLLARMIDENQLPLAQALALPPAAGLAPVYISEALQAELGLRPGQTLTLNQAGAQLPAYVRGVWRDYARQSGALLLSLDDYQRWSGDLRITELFVWLAPAIPVEVASAQLRALAPEAQDLELVATDALRSLSLKIFDRSFAVTVWLQAVALGIGLFGIAASQSAQVLARKREFGLLLHLGFTRAGILRLLAMEAALLCGVGALAGLALGLALSAVLIFVVNPQSFHWSMDLSLPWLRLIGLLAAVFATGLISALLAGRQAARADAVQAVKEDW